MLVSICCNSAVFPADDVPRGLRIRATSAPDKKGVKTVQHGTCVAVDANACHRFILTAAHVVVRPGVAISVEVSADHWIDAKVVAASNDSDLALLKVNEDLLNAALLGDAAELRVSGSPEAHPVADMKGVAVALELATPMAHGMSGSPVFDKDNKIIGMVLAGIASAPGKDLRPDRARIIGIAAIRRFLAEVR
jgi:S1-C subfamily serine protease